MRFVFALAVLASLPMMSACNGGGGSTAEMEEKHGDKRDVTEDWLVGRWAEVDDRDCDRFREFERGGDYREDRGDAQEWTLRDGRGDEMTLEIGRDEYRAERYGSTLVLLDDRDDAVEYSRCERGSGGSGGSSNSENSSATSDSSGAAPPATQAAPADNPQLAAEIAAGVIQLRSQLPIAQGPMTITNVSSAGTQLTLSGNLSVDVNDAQWRQFETGLRQGNCSGDEGAMIRRGASVTTQITDSTGETRSFTTASCPAG